MATSFNPRFSRRNPGFLTPGRLFSLSTAVAEFSSFGVTASEPNTDERVKVTTGTNRINVHRCLVFRIIIHLLLGPVARREGYRTGSTARLRLKKSAAGALKPCSLPLTRSLSHRGRVSMYHYW